MAIEAEIKSWSPEHRKHVTILLSVIIILSMSFYSVVYEVHRLLYHDCVVT